MSIFYDTLQSGLTALNIDLPAAVIPRLEAHWRLVLEYNQRFNLTAITDEEEAALKHYLDCLLLAPQLLGRQRQLAVDIGSGAGFPGLVLALACPQTDWLLLEAHHKKARFLEQCCAELGIKNARVLALRAEEAGQQIGLRENCDLVTARAVAPLAVLLEYALPLLKTGGTFAALKGPALAAEELVAAHALTLLGGQQAGFSAYTLPGGEQRSLACYSKVSPTPAKYPRRPGMPEKRPL